VLSFLRIIYDLLEPGGVWINLGPLLWHFENSPTKSAKGEGSIELSLDEVKALARNVGFEISVRRAARAVLSQDAECRTSGWLGRAIRAYRRACYVTNTR